MMVRPGDGGIRYALAGVLVACLALPAAAAAQQVDWGAVSPGFRGASFVNSDAACADCHENVPHRFDGGAHPGYFTTSNKAVKGTCESCHGPRSKHVQDEQPVAPWSGITAPQQAGICMQCHANSSRMTFKAGAHLAADVSCTACHNGKRPVVVGAGALVRPNASEGCYACHASVRGQMAKASHHPVREGRMECVGCHNVHGSNESLLKASTVTETCHSCHTEKRGPFLWEHPPARENCANCHDAHGSTNRKLLNKKESFLCLQCHSYGGHINLPRYNRTSNPYGEGCVNCHIAVHGSNHPSGAKLTR